MSKSNDVGVAVWDATTGSAAVSRSVGKYMNTMGFKDGGQRLFVEEAVFLLDYGEIRLVSEPGQEKYLSKLDSFRLLSAAGIDMKAYTVFSVLREQRFHVYRHKAWMTPVREWKTLAAPKTYTGRTITRLSSAGEGQPQKRQQLATEPSILPVAYDVYKPQAEFSKNNLQPPDFCIVVISADEFMPSIDSMHSTLSSLGEGVQLRLAVVGDSSVTFVEVNTFDPLATKLG